MGIEKGTRWLLIDTTLEFETYVFPLRTGVLIMIRNIVKENFGKFETTFVPGIRIEELVNFDELKNTEDDGFWILN